MYETKKGFASNSSMQINLFTTSIIRIKNQNTLFSLGMLTYTYDRQEIIQIALKRLPGGGGVP
jgi:hypothetical protein